MEISLNSREFTASKLYRILKELSLNVIDYHFINKYLPDFKEYSQNLPFSEEKIFSLNEGFLTVEKCVKNNKIENGTEFLKRLYEIIKENEEQKLNTKYTLSQLLKALSFIDSSLLLNGKPFPNFKLFVSSIKGEKELFTFEDGINILKAYGKGDKYDFLRNDVIISRIDRAKKQNALFNKRDEKGLMGIDNPKKLRLNEGVKRKSGKSSVWTVKK